MRMTQVLKFGVPTAAHLLCDAPGCDELATSLTTFKVGSEEVLSCNRHHDGLIKPHGVVKRFELLATPGERNIKDELTKNADQ